MLNLFGYRATDRLVMRRMAAPVAPRDEPQANDRALRRVVARVLRQGGIVVAAWGIDGAHLGRGAHVRALLAPHPLHRLATTRRGEPAHPLYLRRNLLPFLPDGFNVGTETPTVQR